MPTVGKQTFPYDRQGRRRARRAAAAAASRPPGQKGPIPPRTPIGVSQGKPAPTGAPIPKDVRPMSAQATGAPRSTLPREGTVGYQFGTKSLIDRLLKEAGQKKLGAYNLTHRRGEPIAALKAHRAKKNRKRKFGGPKDGKSTAALDV